MKSKEQACVGGGVARGARGECGAGGGDDEREDNIWRAGVTTPLRTRRGEEEGEREQKTQ